MLSLIQKYFPDLTPVQEKQFAQLQNLYSYWNNQINVISRKDIDELYERHVLHSLAIAKLIQFTPGTSILDIGTGGGFPGIPLAILFPECDFYLVDSIGKKIKVVEEIASSLNLRNVRASHLRAEKVKEQFDFVVSRAVTNLPAFKNWIKNKFKKKNQNFLKNGLLYLKGGDLKEEIKQSGLRCTIHSISDYFEEDFFETKKIVYWKAV